MKLQAYGDGHTLVCESLVRTAIARYLLAHDGIAAARQAVRGEEGRSFLWTGELFDPFGTSRPIGSTSPRWMRSCRR